MLDQRAAIEADPPVRDAIAVRAARLLDEELSDVEGAIGRYRAILDGSPDNTEAREALWQIARGDDYRQPAVAALEPILRGGAEWPGLVELLELKLAVEDAPAARLEILAEIARIEEAERRDPAAAFAAWARAFAEEVDRGRAAARRWSGWRRRSDDWAGLAAVYEERLSATYRRRAAAVAGDAAGRRCTRGRWAISSAALEFYRKAAESAGRRGAGAGRAGAGAGRRWSGRRSWPRCCSASPR